MKKNSNVKILHDLVNSKKIEDLDINISFSNDLKKLIKKNIHKKQLLKCKKNYVKIDILKFGKFFGLGRKKVDIEYDLFGVGYSQDKKSTTNKIIPVFSNGFDLEYIDKLCFDKISKIYYLLKLYVALQKKRNKIIVSSYINGCWEQAWKMRGLENIMLDMLVDDVLVNNILDSITNKIKIIVKGYLDTGVDILCLADDLGMQSSMMLSEEMYVKFIKYRTKDIIDFAKSINPNIIILYHSCGYIQPLIRHFIEIGVDILTPIQPECMDLKCLADDYSDKILLVGGMCMQEMAKVGKESYIYDYVKKFSQSSCYGNIILNPTEELDCFIPINNIVSYVNAFDEYIKYK